MVKKTVWVLTRENNDYDQHGEYLETVFYQKPTHEELMLALKDIYSWKLTAEFVQHILNGGGRIGNENIWYFLTELECGKPFNNLPPR